MTVKSRTKGVKANPEHEPSMQEKGKNSLKGKKSGQGQDEEEEMEGKTETSKGFWIDYFGVVRPLSLTCAVQATIIPAAAIGTLNILNIVYFMRIDALR